MGFYFEFQRSDDAGYWREPFAPPAFWTLYGIAGFALGCMGLASYATMGQLLSVGTLFDQVVLTLIALTIPAYAMLGIRLAWIRKFLVLQADGFTIGHRLRGWTLWSRQIARDQIVGFSYANPKPSPNNAPKQHSDGKYYIQGHWTLSVELKDGSKLRIDRNTEKDVLEPLKMSLDSWLAG